MVVRAPAGSLCTKGPGIAEWPLFSLEQLAYAKIRLISGRAREDTARDEAMRRALMT